MSNASNFVLLIIDVQQGFDDPSWGARNNPQAEENIAALLVHWRDRDRPVFHVQHLSQNPDSPLYRGGPGSRIKPQVAPLDHEPLILKEVNSAFIGTDLNDRLRKVGYDTLVIVGLTTDHCVSTTARMAANLGFTTFVVADATATFARVGFDGQYFSPDALHAANLASLHQEFATVIDTRAALALS